MAESIGFGSILIISILAFITPLIVSSIKKIKIPFVVGEIFVGLIVGKSGFNIVHNDIWIVFLSNLGLAYLMFLSGLEIDFSMFKGNKESLKILRTCMLMFLASLVTAFAFSFILVKIQIIKNVYFSTVLLMATAPGFLVPVLKQRKLLKSAYGQTILIFSLICEFICLISMTLISAIIKEGISYKSFLFVFIFAAAFGIYLFIKRNFKRILLKIENLSGLHIEVRAAFAVILLLVFLSHETGTEIVLGAFLAGVIFSLISGRMRGNLNEELDIIGYGLLIPIFFIEVGVNLDIGNIITNLKLIAMIPLILVIFYIIKLVSSLFLYKMFNYNEMISASFLLSSQLSLMIVGCQIAYNLGIISQQVYSLFIMTTIISCFLFPVVFDKIFKTDSYEKNQNYGVENISVHEVVLNNEQLCDKKLKEIKFPQSSRVFMIIRDDKEILPNGETILKYGDILILGGVKQHEKEVLQLICGEKNCVIK